MKQKFQINACLLSVCCSVGMLFAAYAQKSYASPKSLPIGAATAVTLVDDGTGSGVYFFSVAMKKGLAYTFWTSGLTEDAALSVYDMTAEVRYSGETDPGSLASYEMARDRVNYRLFVTADSWELDLTVSKCYLVLTGDVGARVTINSANGEVPEPIPLGDPENPMSLSVATTPGRFNGMFLDGAYYFKTTLTAGNKYKFSTAGGSDTDPVTLFVNGGAEVSEPDVLDGDWVDANNEAKIVKPTQTGLHEIVVSGAGSFTLDYQLVPARLPAAHPVTDLTASNLAVAVSIPCSPGYRNLPTSGFNDQFIDEQLFKVQLQKEVSYLFETTGTPGADLVMEIYDARGVIVLRNERVAPNEQNTKIVFKAPLAGVYWIGVCQNQASEDDPIQDGVECAFTARVIGAAEEGMLDAWDHEDDGYLGASGLSPLPGTMSDITTNGVGHGEHTLGLTDLKDWFRLDGRSGITYRLQASLSEEALLAGMDAFTLCAKIYKLSGTTLIPFARLPAVTNLLTGAQFTADTHASYYIELFVQNGQGVDYGPYTVHTTAYQASGPGLGMLGVNILGPTTASGASWSLLGDGLAAPKYPGGATVLLPAGRCDVKFAPVAGWTTPSNQVAFITAGTNATVVTAKFFDTFDTKDDIPSGATLLLPKLLPQTVGRSLWQNDPVDWYKVTVRNDTYYSFALSPAAVQARITVYRANMTDRIAEGRSMTFLSRESGTYFIAVRHEEPAADLVYTLTYAALQVGIVGFDKNSYSVSETLPFAEVRVLRTAKEGRVRVRYTTVQATAVPGDDYQPVQGILDWPQGSNSVQIIRVPLIPDLVDVWDVNKRFSIRLEPIPEDDREVDEWVPALGITETFVTVTENTLKKPGILGFTGTGDTLPEAFEKPLFPALTITAGASATLWISRTGGFNGAVAAKVTTVKGTALENINFVPLTQTITWADGDMEPKSVTVQTIQAQEVYQAPKTLTVRMAIDTLSGGGAKPGVSLVTLTIRDPKVTQTVEEWAVSREKNPPVVVRPSVAGQWFFNASGNLRSTPLAPAGKAGMIVTVTGPGVLRFTPGLIKEGSTNASFTCTLSGKTFAVGGGTNCVLYLGKGLQTLTFTAMRGAGVPGGDTFAYFVVGEEHSPFEWTPLRLAMQPFPVDKEVAMARDNTKLIWKGEINSQMGYRVTVDTNMARVGTDAALINRFVEGENNIISMDLFTALDPLKTYYWRVDTLLFNDPGEAFNGTILLVNTNVIWSFKTAAASAAQTTFKDAQGKSYYAASNDVVVLIQGVATTFTLGGGTTYQLKSGKLPDGLILTAGVISGVPAVAGLYSATFQAVTGTQLGATETVFFDVHPMQLAAGTFNGLLMASTTPTNQHESVSSLNVTVGNTGIITAKAMAGGVAYTFTGKGFIREEPFLENGQPGLAAELRQVTMVGTKPYTNLLTLTVCSGATNDWEALDTLATAKLVLFRPPANAIQQLEYEGYLVRDNTKVSQVKTALSLFRGYYTVSLPAGSSAVEGEDPAGVGYITLTIDVNGSVKIAGQLADGTALTASGIAGYRSDDGTGRPEMWIPVYFAKGTMVFTGWLVLNEDEPSGKIVVAYDSALPLFWINSDPKSTYSAASGYSLEIEPTGGFYDTLFNLQTYYLNTRFSVRMDDPSWRLPEEIYPLGMSTVLAYPGAAAEGETINLVGQTMSVVKRVLVKRQGSVLWDLESSVNPSNLALSFTRATGLFSGSFSLWLGDSGIGEETKQKEQVNIQYKGVLTPVKSMSSEFVDRPGMGYYLVPVTLPGRTWNASYPFEVFGEEFINDWSEGFD